MTNSSMATRVLIATLLLCPVGAAAQQTETTPGSQRGKTRMAERSNLPHPQGFSVVLVLGEMQPTSGVDNVPPAARKALVDMREFLPYKSYRLLDSQWTLCCGRSVNATRLRGLEDQDYDLELDPNPSETSGKWNVRFTLRDAFAGPGRGSSVSSSNITPGDRAAVATQRAELEAKLKSLKERYNDNHPEVQQLKAQIDALDRQQSVARTEENMKRYRLSPSGARLRTLIDTSFTMDIGETVVVGTSRLQGDKALIALLTAVATTKPATTR
jgi:hypothetical protein